MRAERKPCLPSAESPYLPSLSAPELHHTSFGLLPLACALCGAEYDAAPIARVRALSRSIGAGLSGRPTLPPRATIAQRDHPRSGAIASSSRSTEKPELSLDSGFTPLLESARTRPSARRRPGLAQERRRVAPLALLQGSGSRRRPQRGPSTPAWTPWAAPRPATWPTRWRRSRPAPVSRPGSSSPRSRARPRSSAPRCTAPALWFGSAAPTTTSTRLCTQAADRFGWGIVNVNLRSYYGEGSKTVAFEIAEQLGWRLPTAVIAPMAGGSLVTKVRKGFTEFLEAGVVGAGTFLASSERRPRGARRSCDWCAEHGERDSAGDPRYDCALTGHRQSGRRSSRGAGHSGDRWLGRGGVGCRS